MSRGEANAAFRAGLKKKRLSGNARAAKEVRKKATAAAKKNYKADMARPVQWFEPGYKKGKVTKYNPKITRV